MDTPHESEEYTAENIDSSKKPEDSMGVFDPTIDILNMPATGSFGVKKMRPSRNS